MDVLSTDSSETATADGYEADNSPVELDGNVLNGPLTSGVAQLHSISPAGDIDYVKFELPGPGKYSVTLKTSGTSPTDDTEMWLFDSSHNQIDYNDDVNPINWHSYIQRCGPTALAAGTYYAAVDKRGNDAEIASYNITFTINSACIANTTVKVNGQTKGSYWVHPETSTRPSYAGLSNGPAKINAWDGVKPLVASMGVSLKKTAGYESYSEFIGVPGGRLTNTYLFPWYSNASSGMLVTQLCFGNVGSAVTNVAVRIGGVPKGTYFVGINRARCVSFPDLGAGPVQVKSSGGVPIVASLNSRLRSAKGFASYNELGGLSASDTVSTDFMFPVYNNLTNSTTVSQLRVTNVGSSDTVVTITVAGVDWPTTYPLTPNQSALVSLANVNTGPVHVRSSNQVPISVSMIVKLKATDTKYTSYTEVMALPEAPLIPGGPVTETRFVFPWYNNLRAGNLFSQLRITNIGNKSTSVTVTIAGNTNPAKISLLARQSQLVQYDNISNGPVVLQSSGGVPIVASMIVYMKKGFGFNSYSEFIGQLGLPGNQLEPIAWFPWYSNTGNFVSQLRFALPAKP